MSHPEGDGRVSRVRETNPADPTTNQPQTTATSGSRSVDYKASQGISSSQVSWWAAHEFLVHLVAQVGVLPVAGTPAWQALSADDPRKLLALAVAGEHHVLRTETAQEAMAAASRAVAAAADWSQVARETIARNSFREHHPEARRVAS